MVILPLLLGVLLVTAAVHFISILAMPALATDDAYARLARLSPESELVQLSRERLDRLNLPFLDPAFSAGACRYDLRNGVMRLRAPAPDTLMLITLIAKGRGVFFSITDRAAINGVVEVLIGTDAQIDQIEAADREDDVAGELRVRSPVPDGIAFIRVLAPDLTSRADAAAVVAQTSCQPETL